MKPFIAVVVLFAACAGCVSDSGSWSAAAGSSMFTTDEGTVHRGLAVLCRDERPYLVLLVAGGEPQSASSNGRKSRGSIRTAHGDMVEWTCTAEEQGGGVFEIRGEHHRLEQGGIVLVDLRGGKRRMVEQTTADMSKLADGSIDDRLKELAATDAEVARFIQATETPR